MKPLSLLQEQSTMDKETRKVMYNKFTNMQRLDRGVGSRLKWQFMDRHNIEETDTIECLEVKADVSFSIFGSDGYLLYESKKYRMKHVSMIKNYAGLYYFIPQKMLIAFGSQWNRRYRPNRTESRTRIKSEPDLTPTSLPPATSRSAPTTPTEFNRKKMSPPSISTAPSVRRNYTTNKNSVYVARSSPRGSPQKTETVQKQKTEAVDEPETPKKEKTESPKKFSPTEEAEKAHMAARKRFETVDLSALYTVSEMPGYRKIAPAKSTNSSDHPHKPSQPENNAKKTDPKLSNPQLLKSPVTTRSSTPLSIRIAPRTRAGKSSREMNIKNSTTIAVPRDSAALRDPGSGGPTVRLLTVGRNEDSLKRSPEPANQPGKRISNIQSINVISDNKIYAKGEVLLTTKDHIIFRIPRNVSNDT